MRSQAARRLRQAKLESIPRPVLAVQYSSSSRNLQPRRSPPEPPAGAQPNTDAVRSPIPEDATPTDILELLTRGARSLAEFSKDGVSVEELGKSQTSQGGSPPAEPSNEGEAAVAGRPKVRRVRLQMPKEKESDVEMPPRPTLEPQLMSKIYRTPRKTSGNPNGNEPSGSSNAVNGADEASTLAAEVADSKLPPPYLLDEVEHKLRVILHPQAQMNSMTKSMNGSNPIHPFSEPALALLCPIEGGNHVVDATVDEIAQRLDADVTVLDAVQLAAGSNGAYGEAASSFEFSPNPLHSQPPIKDAPSTAGSADEEGSPAFQMMSSPALSIQIPTIMGPLGPLGDPSLLRPSRSSSISKRREDRIKRNHFFEALIHAPSKVPEEDERRAYDRPRLIYIRDFEFIAESGPSWYPHLVRAVQNLRQGNQPRVEVVNPTAIILGVSPDLGVYRKLESTSTSTPSTGSSQQPTHAPEDTKTQASDRAFLSTDEEEGKKIRDRSVRSWLKEWDQYGESAIRDELPWFDPFNVESSSRGSGLPKGISGGLESVRIAGPIGSSPELREQIARMIQAVRGNPPTEETPDDDESQYSSVAAVMPSVRQPELELSERLQRRREINQLAFRSVLRNMGGVVPGRLEEYVEPTQVQSQVTNEAESDSAEDLTRLMFIEWENNLIDRETIREVAVRALGQSIAARGSNAQSQAEPTPNRGLVPDNIALTTVTWDEVALAWRQWFLNDRQRKAWIAQQRRKRSTKKGSRPVKSADEAIPEVDEVIESVKHDPTLDTHEKRLLGCIVDTQTVPTTFANVHLPVKTVDAIRTMVSLPLLYPKAFSEGVLKNHSMSGALLLGPPGVGKTLLARAVARESGARMLMVKPSDVMDMYVGEGEKLVKSVFSLARRLSPCVIFLDEVDALLASRISSRESGSAIAHRSVITEFMQEMDGLKTNKSQGNVIVIGATNRPFDLDDAVLRRLPRRLLIDLPGEKERLEILKIHLREETLADDVDLTTLAKQTEMYSGSDLKNLCVAAALDAVKESLQLPWLVDNQSAEASQSDQNEARQLHQRHFARALTEITPSSSESLGTLHELRKWNEEFGEGRVKSGGRKTKWGSKFGFGGKDSKDVDGRVMSTDITP